MSRRLAALAPAVLCLAVCWPISAAEPPAGEGKDSNALPAVATKTAGLAARPGLLTLYFDEARGKVWLELPPAGKGGVVAELLYVEGIATGVGSNPIGLDRGQLGNGRVVTLRRVGGRLLIEQPNLWFRALSSDPREVESVRQSFATSVLWAGEIAALDPDGRALVDFTPFLLRDAHGVAATLKRAGQGSYTLDAGRSAVDLEACLVFPENVELESVLSFGAAEPGELVSSVLATPELLTVTLHQSFLRLPEPGYRPRRFDPRAGSFSIHFQDYAAPLAAPIETRWIVRHRLQKVDPAAPRSRVRKPIVYYVDAGAPEPVKSALIEGASWWARAFEEAGFIDAFRVEVLPPGAHPLDARYHVIQWVHRSTRGWSYGGGIIDPRTGEMVKGHVTLGSLRVRQDRLLFEGLLGTQRTGSGAADDPTRLALWRIKQLAAHEVGHALGLAHNFASSTYGGRASVMDYPAPLVGITPAGELDLSQAYGVGVGAWDLHAVRYAYSEFAAGTDERAELERIAAEAVDKGLLFLSDVDARPLGSAHPLAHLWDNGADPVAALEHTLRVRELALSRFGERNLAPGQPLALLEEVLATVYLHHRYQVEATAKLVAGMDYRYALRGDAQPQARPVAAEAQRRALSAVLSTLEPAALDLPEAVLGLLLPRPAEYEPNREQFASATWPAFDALGAAAAAADLAVAPLVEPRRAARLVDQHRRDGSLPGLEEVIDALVDRAFERAPAPPRLTEIQRAVQSVVASRLIGLAADRSATPAVRARADAALAELRHRLRQPVDLLVLDDPGEQPFRAFLAAEIDRYLERPPAAPNTLPAPPESPPGSPIGGQAASFPDPRASDEDGCSLGWVGNGR